MTEIVEVNTPSTLKEIGNSGFYGCTNLQKINLKEGLEIIGPQAFRFDSKLQLETLPSTVKEIQEFSFEGCTSAFSELVIPENINHIGSYAFNRCVGITKISTPSTLRIIADYAFNQCSNIEEVKLGEGLQFILDNAFSNCTLLDRVEIPSTVYFVGIDIFQKCDNISYIKINQEKDSLTGSPWGTEANPLVIWKGDDTKEYTITTNDENLDVLSVAYGGQTITVKSKSDEKAIVSMEINGEVVQGNIFKMPNENVTIANVVYNEQLILQSSHTYENNIDQTWEAQFDEETAIKIEFSSDTYTGYSDYIWLYNSDGIFIRKYYQDELAGKTIYLNDNGIKIRLVTDDSMVYYGFKCYITKTDEIGFNSMETSHPYKEKSDYAFITKVEDAEKVQVTFNEQTTLEDGDIVNIYSTDESYINTLEDSANPLRITLNKDNITSRQVVLNGDSASIILSSATGTKSAYGINYTIEKYETPENVLESDHYYTNNLDETKTKTISGANYLKLTFDDETYVENYNDYILIYDKDGYQIGKYSGANLTGQTIIVTGDTVQIRLTSNSYTTGYGYKCTVEAIDLEHIDEEQVLESSHQYTNNLNETYEATIAGADIIEIEFNSNSFTEYSFDNLYISGEDGIEIMKLSGNLAGQKVIIVGDTVRIRFYTDGSVTAWGFRCTVKGYNYK